MFFQFNLFNSSGDQIGMLLNNDLYLAFVLQRESMGMNKCKVTEASTKPNMETVDMMGRAAGRVVPNRFMREETYPPCAHAPTKDLVNKYVNDPKCFMQDFVKVLTKMIEKEAPHLKAVRRRRNRRN